MLGWNDDRIGGFRLSSSILVTLGASHSDPQRTKPIMRFLERILMTIVATLTMAVSASAATLPMAVSGRAAMAVSYSGNWPLKVTHTQYGFTKCLTLTDNGSLGFPHSGPASLTSPGVSGSLTGTFQLIDNLLVATIQAPASQGGAGQNAGLVFIGPASNGHIGNGAFDEVYGGEEFVSGVLQFGMKGGC